MKNKISWGIALVLFLANSSTVFAIPVDAGFAKKVGERFITSEIMANQHTQKDYLRQKKNKQSLDFFPPTSQISTITPIYKRANSGQIVAYVIQLKPEGYVVTSSDTDIQPIIAYSHTGRFPLTEEENNPVLDLIKWDMEARLKAIPIMSKAKLSENSAKWFDFKKRTVKKAKTADTVTTWGPYIKTWWNQSENDYVPYDYIAGKKSYVGCIATAMAQIINYWQYPQSVSFGSADKYTSINRKIKIDDDNANNVNFLSFSELNKKLTNIQYSDEDIKHAISFATGISVKMNYTGDNGSMAFSSRISGAFKNKFGYKNAKHIGALSKKYDDLIVNIKEGKPAILSIHRPKTDTDKDGDHSIIADGYKSTGEYHLNFGWGDKTPSADPWYSLPSGMPKGYSVVKSVIIDIYPPTTATAKKPIAPSNLNATPLSSSSIQVTWTDNSNNETKFNVFRWSGQWTLAGSVNANITSYIDNGLTAGKTYHYIVQSVNAKGKSLATNYVTATTSQDTVKWGAFAINGQTASAFGFSYNYLTALEAETRALTECSSRGTGCYVVLKFSGGCGAYAAGSTGLGWGNATTEQEAKNIAVNYCTQNSSSSDCVVKASFCNF